MTTKNALISRWIFKSFITSWKLDCNNFKNSRDPLSGRKLFYCFPASGSLIDYTLAKKKKNCHLYAHFIHFVCLVNKLIYKIWVITSISDQHLSPMFMIYKFEFSVTTIEDLIKASEESKLA